MIAPSTLQPGGTSRLGGTLVHPERSDRQPSVPEGSGFRFHVGQRVEGGCRQVDGSVCSPGRRGPGSLEELCAGGDQVFGTSANPLGITEQDVALRGEQADERLHVVDQNWGQRFHALDGMPLGDLVQHLGEAGMGRGERSSTVTYAVGQQQLPARRSPERLSLAVAKRPLVADRERANLLHDVAPEFHPERVLFGRWEDVDDAAAHREFAAPLHQVDPHVGGVRQLPDEPIQTMVGT